MGPAFVRVRSTLDLDRRQARSGAPLDGAAIAAALDSVAAGFDDAAAGASGDARDILRAQAALARDRALRDDATDRWQAGAAPARAVVDAAGDFAARLAATGNAYLAARAPDLRHIGTAAARALLGLAPDVPPVPPPGTILVADELTPAEATGLVSGSVVAVVTEGGTPTSHAAIVARGLGIPAVMGVRHLLEAVSDRTLVAVDGDTGEVYLDPDDATRARLAAAGFARLAARDRVRAEAGMGPSATADGHAVEVAANIRAVDELRAALAEGAEGVGLLRTELLYIDRPAPPSEAEQVAVLAEMRALLGPRRLIVRTFDIGSDKPVPFLPARPEANPELGMRGIRLARLHPELIDVQLAAVAAAAEQGPVGVMAPMVTGIEDVDWFVARAAKVGGGQSLEVGVMVEVPAAVLLMPEIARRVDFVSIGTNDLSQYLHAADRRAADLAALNDPFDPALLRAIAMVGRSAAGRCWVGVCGEAAGRPAWALIAVGLGVTELSMQAVQILPVRAALRAVTLGQCRDLAQRACRMTDAASVRSAAEDLLAER
ncbi:MAG TPA: phosphoenolpyruvate--protein phosphotransferase, partial [Acidimicrobiia bacterium]|nr:phosphoenolpyruvate--protein phosphotransferase [Acidimicrobiia bacterium]